MSRSRIAAAAAALALVGASIFAGATVAYANPALTVDTPADGSYIPQPDYTGLVVSGTTSGDTSISIIVSNAASGASYPGCYQTFSGDDSTPWSCTIADTDLIFGANTVSVTATASDTTTTTVDSTFYVYELDESLDIVAPTGSGSDRNPVISGTGPALGRVAVNVCDATAFVDENGNWSCVPYTFSYGTTSIGATSYTYGNENSTSTESDYTVLVPPSNPTYGDGAANVSIDMGAPIVDLEPHNYVTPVLPVPLESEGPCADQICSFPLDPGVVRIDTAYQATDGSGETGTFRRDYWRTPDAPTLDTPVDNGDGSWTFSGTGVTDGDLVRVRDDVNYRCQDTIVGGTWSCTIPSSPVGAINYVAIAQSVGFDAATAGIVDPEMGASYNGYSATTQSETITTPSSFTQDLYTAYRGQTVTITGEHAADDPDFAVMYDTNGVYTEACVPVQNPGETAFACDIDTSAAPSEVSSIVAGTFSSGFFVAGTMGATELRVLETTTLDQVGDAGGFVLSDTVTVGGTTDYTAGELYVTTLGGPGCTATVTPGGTWSCELSMLDTSQSDTVSVSRGEDATWPVLASQAIQIVTPPTVNQDDTGHIFSSDDRPIIEGVGAYDGEYDTTVTVDVSGNGVTPFTCSTVVGDGQPESNQWGCELDTLPNGTYTLEVRQSPGWAGGRFSDPVVVTLEVSSALGAIECSFSPGGLVVSSSDENARIGLYRVGDLGEGWTPQNLGLCSGAAGTPSPGTFDDSFHAGQCEMPAGEGSGTSGYFTGDPIAGCPASGLAPGMWNLYYGLGGGEGSLYYDWFFTVPEPPLITTAQAGTSVGTADFAGTGVSGDTVRVQNSLGDLACTATVVGGNWACSPVLGESSFTYMAYEVDAVSGGMSPLSAATATITIAGAPAPPVPTPTPTPTPTATPTPTPTPTVKPPFTWTLTMTGVDGPLRPGQFVGLSSSGIPEGSTVVAELHSTPVVIGTTTVAASGTFDFDVMIPFDTVPGDHHIVVTVTPPGDSANPIENEIAVVIDPPAKDRAVLESGHDDRFQELLNTGNPRNELGAPTALTRSLPTIVNILNNPIALGLAGALALAIMLLVAIPAEVLNSTLEANTGRFGRFFAAIQNGFDRATAWFTRVTRTPAIAAALLVLLTSVVFGFVDPKFGFDLASLRLVLSVGVALFVVTFVASRITGAIIRKAWTLESKIEMMPVAILFAIIGVIVARLLDFSPGFLIGLVIGLELAHRATELQAVRAIAIELGVIVGLGIVAWLGYNLLVFAQGDSPATFFRAFTEDTLVAITAEGITAVMVAILPLGFLDGRTIWQKSKRLWVLMFLIIAVAFSLLVLPTALEGQNVGDIGWWLLVLLAFAVITVLSTVVFRLVGRRSPAESPAPEKVQL